MNDTEYETKRISVDGIDTAYIEAGTMTADVLDGWWTDAGTFDSLLRASGMVADGGANRMDL